MLLFREREKQATYGFKWLNNAGQEADSWDQITSGLSASASQISPTASTNFTWTTTRSRL